MATIEEQIKALEEELAKTPHHKATDHHIGRMRAKIAHLKDEKLNQTLRSGGGGGGGYAVKKHGDATIVLVGPPSVGKSTLINQVTNAKSKVAEYSFTTVSVIPGMMEYKGANFQILDVPGLIQGAREGKGRGREVLSVVRNADLVIMMSDIYKVDVLKILEKELYEAGLRVNVSKPNVKVDKHIDGGINVFTNLHLDYDKEMIREVARESGIKNADITIKENLSIERLIDTFSTNRVYIPAIYLINKADLAPRSATREVGADYHYISADKGTGIDALKEAVWQKLGFATVYLVRPMEEPSYNNPIITQKGTTLSELAHKIGTNFAEGKKKAKIWGKGSKFAAQEVSLKTQIQDGMQVRFI